MCDQQRLRSACACAQSDQSLCYSLGYSMTLRLLTEHHLEFLSLIGGCTGSSESTLVKTPHCWKSHVTAHIYMLSHFQLLIQDIWCIHNHIWFRDICCSLTQSMGLDETLNIKVNLLSHSIAVYTHLKVKVSVSNGWMDPICC